MGSDVVPGCAPSRGPCWRSVVHRPPRANHSDFESFNDGDDLEPYKGAGISFSEFSGSITPMRA
jgi:hypothetical protein